MKLERNREMLKMFNDGITCTKIAEKFGTTKQNVSKIVKRQAKRDEYYFNLRKEYEKKILEI